MKIFIKRVYEKFATTDGFRILVDRLWPRGESKAKAQIDLWLRDIAPSAKLRQWFGHKPERFAEFTKRYRAELRTNRENLKAFEVAIKGKKIVTLVYGAKDELHNQAVVLKQFLEK